MKIQITKLPSKKKANIKAIGGTLQSHGSDWSTGSTHINAGGSHEENPNEGVQVGVDPEGKPNLVEEGEVIYNDYVYSNRIELDDEAKERFHFSKKQDITYADAAKKLEKEASERPNDPISTSALKIQMAKLAEEQERQKQEMQAKEAREAFAQLSPEEQVALMQQLQAQQQGQGQPSSEEQAMMEQQAMQEQGMGQPQMSPEEQAMMEQQMAMQGGGQPMMGGVPPMGINAAMAQQPMMAYGGMLTGVNMFKDGGALKWLKKHAGNTENIESVAKWMEDRISEYEKSRNITLNRRQRNKLYAEYYIDATKNPQQFASDFDGTIPPSTRMDKASKAEDEVEAIEESITPYQDVPDVMLPSYDTAKNWVNNNFPPGYIPLSLPTGKVAAALYNIAQKNPSKYLDLHGQYYNYDDLHDDLLTDYEGKNFNISLFNDLVSSGLSRKDAFTLMNPYTVFIPGKADFPQLLRENENAWRDLYNGYVAANNDEYIKDFDSLANVIIPSYNKPPEVLPTSSGDIPISNSTDRPVISLDTTETGQPVEKDASIVPPKQEVVNASVPRTYEPFSYDAQAFLNSVRDYNGESQLGRYTNLKDYINDPGYKAFTDEIVNFLKDPIEALVNGAIPKDLRAEDPKIDAYLQYLKMLYDKEPYFKNTLFTQNSNGTWNIGRGAASAYNAARNGMLGDQFYRVHLTPTYIDKNNESGTSQEPTGVGISGASAAGNVTTGAGEVQPVVEQPEVVQKPRRRTKAQMKADRMRAEKYNEEWFLNRAKELGMVSPDATKIEGFKHDQDNPDANLANFNNLYRAWQREQARDTYVKGQRKKKENELFDPIRGMYRYSNDKSRIYKYDIADQNYDYYIDANGTKIDQDAYNALKDDEKGKYRHRKGLAGDRILDFDNTYKQSEYKGTIDELLDSYKDKYEEGFDWKPENASKLKYPVDIPHSKLSDLRYAPIFTNAASFLYNLFNSPDYGRAQSVIDLANSYVPRMVSPIPVYSGYTYNPKDIWTLANAGNAVNAATNRAILNSGLTAGGTAAGLLAGAYNGILGMGENVQSVNDYNDKQRLAKAEFDLKPQQANAAADMQAQLANQGAIFNGQQHRYQGLAAGNAMKDAIDASRNAAINTTWSNLGASAGNLGDEEQLKDIITWLEQTGTLKSNMFADRYDYLTGGNGNANAKYGGMLTIGSNRRRRR